MKTSILVLLLLPIFANAQKSLNVTGKITGLKEKTLVWLTDVNRPTDTLAKSRVKAGVFVLKATLTEPRLVHINIEGQEPVMSFFDNSSIKITGDSKQLKNLTFTGSQLPNHLKTFHQEFDPLFERMMKINQRLQFDRSDSTVSAMNRSKDTIETTIDKFINTRRSSPVSAFILAATFQLTDDVAVTEGRIAKLKEEAMENMYGTFLKETILETKITAVGSTASDFTQADTSGAPITLSSFRGKYVLLDFWASWCGPCRQENPNVVATFNKFNMKNFTVLGVSLDRPGQKEKWLQAIHADNLTWTHVSDLQFWNNAVAQQYRIQSIPQNLLIGPDGKIVAKNLRGPALEAKLCEVLGCN